MIATPAQVQQALTLSDEEIAELRKQQDKALKTFRSKARLTPEERQMGYAIEMERHHRRTGNKDALAEALGMQGRFREAAETATSDVLRNVLLEKARAVEKPDVNCACPDYEEEGNLKIPTQYIEANVIRDGVLTPAIRCRKCGDLNIRPIPIHLAEQRMARTTSVGNEGKQVSAEEFFRK